MLWHLLQPQLTQAVSPLRKKVIFCLHFSPVLLRSLSATLWICDQSVGTHLTFKPNSTETGEAGITHQIYIVYLTVSVFDQTLGAWLISFLKVGVFNFVSKRVCRWLIEWVSERVGGWVSEWMRINCHSCCAPFQHYMGNVSATTNSSFAAPN